MDKDTVIIVRLNRDDKEKVRKKAEAEGMSMSSYIRKIITEYKIISRTDASAILQLKRIGVNINQIARNLNTNNCDDNIEKAIRWFELYDKEIKTVINRIVK